MQKGDNMKIGFIGLGIMGESMSENIVKKHDGKLIQGSDYLRITHEDDYVELTEIDLRD